MGRGGSKSRRAGRLPLPPRLPLHLHLPPPPHPHPHLHPRHRHRHRQGATSAKAGSRGGAGGQANMAWQQDSSTSISIRVYTRERHRKEAPERGTREALAAKSTLHTKPPSAFFSGSLGRDWISPQTHIHTHTRARATLFSGELHELANLVSRQRTKKRQGRGGGRDRGRVVLKHCV